MLQRKGKTKTKTTKEAPISGVTKHFILLHALEICKYESRAITFRRGQNIILTLRWAKVVLIRFYLYLI